MSPNADLESQALLEGIQENEGEGDGDDENNQSPDKSQMDGEDGEP